MQIMVLAIAGAIAFTVVGIAVWRDLWLPAGRFAWHSPLFRSLIASGGLAVAGMLVALLKVSMCWPDKRAVFVVSAGFALGAAAAGMLVWDQEMRPMPPDEYAHMISLFHVANEQILSDTGSGGMAGTSIAVVDRDALRRAVLRIQDAVFEANRGLLRHFIIVGGPDAALTDDALRKTARWLPRCRPDKVEIIIVTPTPVSAETVRLLQDRGIAVAELPHDFPDVSTRSSVFLPEDR